MPVAADFLARGIARSSVPKRERPKKPRGLTLGPGFLSGGRWPFDHNLYPVDDADRAIVHAETLLSLLSEDPRVAAAFQEWIGQAPADPRGLPISSDLRERCERLVFETLRLPFRWLADWIEAIFLRMYFTREPPDYRIIEPAVTVEVRPGESTDAAVRRTAKQYRKPKTRRPAHGGAIAASDVSYWYWNRIAHPTLSLRTLAIAGRVGDNTDIIDTKAIRYAIRRAEAVLRQIGTGGPSYISLHFLTRGE